VGGAVSTHAISRTVRDSAALLDVIAGPEPGDPFIVRPPARPFSQELQAPTQRLRIALSTASPIGGAVDAAWSRAASDCGQLLQSLGHHVEWIDPVGDGLQLARDYLAMYFGQVAAQLMVAAAGCSCFGFRDGHPGAWADRTRSCCGRLRPGACALEHPMRALGQLFTRFDLYLTPTCAQPPARIGELAAPRWQRTALQLILQFGLGGVLRRSGLVEQLAFDNLHRTPFTQLANLTGTPAMSVPWALDDNGLPVGVQFGAAWGVKTCCFNWPLNWSRNALGGIGARQSLPHEKRTPRRPFLRTDRRQADASCRRGLISILPNRRKYT
jgi:Asp-tRNAAsn/Glu-tRNAGln amidotransferase A subunit and related amidases